MDRKEVAHKHICQKCWLIWKVTWSFQTSRHKTRPDEYRQGFLTGFLSVAKNAKRAFLEVMMQICIKILKVRYQYQIKTASLEILILITKQVLYSNCSGWWVHKIIHSWYGRSVSIWGDRSLSLWTFCHWQQAFWKHYLYTSGHAYRPAYLPLHHSFLPGTIGQCHLSNDCRHDAL